MRPIQFSTENTSIVDTRPSVFKFLRDNASIIIGANGQRMCRCDEKTLRSRQGPRIRLGNAGRGMISRASRDCANMKCIYRIIAQGELAFKWDWHPTCFGYPCGRGGHFGPHEVEIRREKQHTPRRTAKKGKERREYKKKKKIEREGERILEREPKTTISQRPQICETCRGAAPRGRGGRATGKASWTDRKARE